MTMDLREALGTLHEQTRQTPLFNPVFQLGLDLSRRLESGDLSLADIAAMVEDLGCEALQSRAHRLHNLLAPMAEDENLSRLRSVVERSAADGDFTGFAARWARPLQHIVFTGHPTFLLSAAEADAVAGAATQDDVGPAMCIINTSRDAVTLASEHAQTLSAMARAGQARDRIVRTILSVAQGQWPLRWRALTPMPFRFATWVGYDMDGRTDIGWHTSIRHRLIEKAMRLGAYADDLAGIEAASDMAATLRRAATHAAAMADRFIEALDDPAALADAANALTADHPDRMVSLALD